jgi:hypothetical protein
MAVLITLVLTSGITLKGYEHREELRQLNYQLQQTKADLAQTTTELQEANRKLAFLMEEPASRSERSDEPRSRRDTALADPSPECGSLRFDDPHGNASANGCARSVQDNAPIRSRECA